jgi:hypothetical protein
MAILWPESGSNRCPELPCKESLPVPDQLAISTLIGFNWPNTAS